MPIAKLLGSLSLAAVYVDAYSQLTGFANASVNAPTGQSVVSFQLVQHVTAGLCTWRHLVYLTC